MSLNHLEVADWPYSDMSFFRAARTRSGPARHTAGASLARTLGDTLLHL